MTDHGGGNEDSAPRDERASPTGEEQEAWSAGYEYRKAEEARAGAAPRDERNVRGLFAEQRRAVWLAFGTLHVNGTGDIEDSERVGRALDDLVAAALSPAPAARGGGETRMAEQFEAGREYELREGRNIDPDGAPAASGERGRIIAWLYQKADEHFGPGQMYGEVIASLAEELKSGAAASSGAPANQLDLAGLTRRAESAEADWQYWQREAENLSEQLAEMRQLGTEARAELAGAPDASGQARAGDQVAWAIREAKQAMDEQTGYHVTIGKHTLGLLVKVALSSGALAESGVERIAAERRRQVEAEGWTPEHDDGHTQGEIARAAACYAMPPESRRDGVLLHWPWKTTDWKPGDRIRDLEKAGALIVAEIERLSRAAQQGAAT